MILAEPPIASSTAGQGTGPSPEVRRDILRAMIRVRLVEEAIAVRYAEQEMRCPTHLCIGQEAVPAAVSALLAPGDMVFSAHRSHGHYLCKGGDLPAMLAELYGRATGCARGIGGSQHLIDLAAGFMGSAPILASTISVGVGAAWGSVMRGEPRVVVIYFGDGATEEGTFHEALNLAATYRLPVLFVCENNLYSVHSALDIRQPKRDIASLAAGHGMAGSKADGNDADVVWRVADAAIARARRGEGPSLLEFSTYRWYEHCGPGLDDALGYRPAAEIAEWRDRCPIVAQTNRLTAEAVLTPGELAGWNDAIAAEVDRAFSFARSSPFPQPADLAAYVYPA